MAKKLEGMEANFYFTKLRPYLNHLFSKKTHFFKNK